MKKILIIIAATSFLISCSKDSESPEPEVVTPTSTTLNNPTPDSNPVCLNVIMNYDWTMNKAGDSPFNVSSFKDASFVNYNVVNGLPNDTITNTQNIIYGEAPSYNENDPSCYTWVRLGGAFLQLKENKGDSIQIFHRYPSSSNLDFTAWYYKY